MSVDLDRKYKKVSDDYNKFIKYTRIGSNLLMPVFLMALFMLSSFEVISDESKTNAQQQLNLSEYRIPITIIFVIMASVAGVSFKKIRDFRINADQRAGVMVYRAYKSVSDFIDGGLREIDKKAAKKNLKKLNQTMSQWVGRGPTDLYRPVRELRQAMQNRLIQIIESGSEGEAEQVRMFLFNFLLRIDGGLTFDVVNETTTVCKTLPMKVTPEAQKQKWQIFQDYPFKSLMFAAIFGVIFYLILISQELGSGAALGYSVPASIALFATLEFAFKRKP